MSARIVLVCEPTSLPFCDRTLTLDYKGIEVLRAGCGSPRSLKAPDNAVFDCKCMSRHHARLWYESDSFFIQDTKSSNGTFVNGKRLSETGETSLPTEVFTKDVVQFGIHILDHNTHEIIQRCVIASLLCYLPTDEGGPNTLSTTRTSTAPDAGVTSNDINLLNLYVQKALHRESILERKMAQMKRLIESSARACQRGWKSMVHEDDLLFKIHSLEKQIELYSKDYSEDKLRNELVELRKQKFMYEKTEREGIEKSLRTNGNQIYKCPKVMVDVRKLEYVREKVTCIEWESERDYVAEVTVRDLEEPTEVRFELNTLKQERNKIHSRLLECEGEIMARMARINSLEEKANINNLEMKTLADEVHFSEADLENAETEKDVHLQKCFDIDNQLKDMDSIELASKIIQFRKNKEGEEELQRILKEYEFVTGLIALKADSEVKVQTSTLSIGTYRDEVLMYQGKLNAKTEDGNVLRRQINELINDVAAELETYEMLDTRSNWLKGLTSEIAAKQREISVSLGDKRKHIEKLEKELLIMTQANDVCGEVVDGKENEKAEESNAEPVLTIVKPVSKTDKLGELGDNQEQDSKAVNADLVQKLKDLETFVNVLVEKKSTKVLQVDVKNCESVQLADLTSNTSVEDCNFVRRFKELEVVIAGLVNDEEQEERDRLMEEERKKNEALLLRLKEEKEELLKEERRKNEALLLRLKEEKEGLLEEERRKNEELLLRLKELELANDTKNVMLTEKNVLEVLDKIQDDKAMLSNSGTNEVPNHMNDTAKSIQEEETSVNQSEATLDCCEVKCFKPFKVSNSEKLHQFTDDDQSVKLENLNIKPLSVSDLTSGKENDYRFVMQHFNKIQPTMLTTSVYHMTQVIDQHRPSLPQTDNVDVTNEDGTDNTISTEQELNEDDKLETKTDNKGIKVDKVLIEENGLNEELNETSGYSDTRANVGKESLNELLEIEDMNSVKQDEYVEETEQVTKEFNDRLAGDVVNDIVVTGEQEEKGGGEVEKVVVEDLTGGDLGEIVEEGGDNLKLKVTDGENFKPETKTVRPQRARRRPAHLDSFAKPKEDLSKLRLECDLPISPKKVDYALVDDSHVSNNFEIINDTVETSKEIKQSRMKTIKQKPKLASKSITNVTSNLLQKKSSTSSNVSQKANSSVVEKEEGGKAQLQLDPKPSQTFQTTITVIVVFICILVAVELFY